MSLTAKAAFFRHFWYLSEELVALAFFDERISNTEKSAMVKALKKTPKTSSPKRPKFLIDKIEQITLSDCITKRTRNFFKILDLPQSFLKRKMRNKSNTWCKL